MKNIRVSFASITSISSKEKGKSLLFLEFFPLSAFRSLLTSKTFYSEFVVNCKVVDLWDFVPMQPRNSSIGHMCKKIMAKIPRLAQIFRSRNLSKLGFDFFCSSLALELPHDFDLLDSQNYSALSWWPRLGAQIEWTSLFLSFGLDVPVRLESVDPISPSFGLGLGMGLGYDKAIIVISHIMCVSMHI